MVLFLKTIYQQWKKGLIEAMEEGVIAGYPVVDIKATLFDGSYHSVDSSEMAFKVAASQAFKKGNANRKICYIRAGNECGSNS